jgi:hypothetical protein
VNFTFVPLPTGDNPIAVNKYYYYYYYYYYIGLGTDAAGGCGNNSYKKA